MMTANQTIIIIIRTVWIRRRWVVVVVWPAPVRVLVFFWLVVMLAVSIIVRVMLVSSEIALIYFIVLVFVLVLMERLVIEVISRDRSLLFNTALVLQDTLRLLLLLLSVCRLLTLVIVRCTECVSVGSCSLLVEWWGWRVDRVVATSLYSSLSGGDLFRQMLEFILQFPIL